MEEYIELLTKFIVNDMAADENEAAELLDIAEMFGYMQ